MESSKEDTENNTMRTKNHSRKSSLPTTTKNQLGCFRDGSHVKDRHRISMRDIVPEDYREDVQSPIKCKRKLFTARDADDSRFSKM